MPMTMSMARGIMTCFTVLLVLPAMSELQGRAEGNKCAESLSNRGTRLTYEQALDCILSPPGSYDWALRLRYVPSFHEESEILVARASNSKYTLRSVVAQKSVHKLFQDRGTLGPEELVRLSAIPIAERELVIDSGQAKTWIEEFLSAVAATPKYISATSDLFRTNNTLQITLDGTRFTASFLGTQVECRLSFQGPEVGTESRREESSPVVQWMLDFKGKAELLLKDHRIHANGRDTEVLQSLISP